MSYKAMFLDGPLHGAVRVVETDTFDCQAFDSAAAEAVYHRYRMGQDYETEGEYAGAIHFRYAGVTWRESLRRKPPDQAERKR